VSYYFIPRHTHPHLAGLGWVDDSDESSGSVKTEFFFLMR